jgi:hypothetical protein
MEAAAAAAAAAAASGKDPYANYAMPDPVWELGKIPELPPREVDEQAYAAAGGR